MHKRLIFFLFICFSAAYLLSGQEVERIETEIENDEYRTTVFLKEDFSGAYKAFTLDGISKETRTRLVFDFSGMTLPKTYSYDETYDTYINRIRTGQFKKDIMRVVFYTGLAEEELFYSINPGTRSIIISVRERNAVSTEVDPGKEPSPDDTSAEPASSQDDLPEPEEDRPVQPSDPKSVIFSKVSPADKSKPKEPEAGEKSLSEPGSTVQETVHKGNRWNIHRILFPTAVIILLYQFFSYVFSFKLFGGFFAKHKKNLLKNVEKDYFKKARFDYIIFLIKLVILCILLLYSIFIYANYNILF